MGARAAARALSVVLILGLGLPPGALGCPQPCACYLPTEVHCTFRSLAAVPARISKHVERINFGFVWQGVANGFAGQGAESRSGSRTAISACCFLSRIAETGGYSQALCFKHYQYWCGESFSVAFLFQRRVTVVFK